MRPARCWGEGAGGGMDSAFFGRGKNLHSAGQYLLPWQLRWKERTAVG